MIDAVEAMNLAAFFAAYREDGHGRSAHEPSMMVALLLYCYVVVVLLALLAPKVAAFGSWQSPWSACSEHAATAAPDPRPPDHSMPGGSVGRASPPRPVRE